jgi:uncharacterized repeat protein (TIGR03803 family)
VISASIDGNQLTSIHAFQGLDGSLSQGGLALGGNRIYGTTLSGGDNNEGVVFAMGTDGSDFIVLHSFSDASNFSRTNSDGAAPLAGLLLSGNTLFGTTCAGGAGGCGTVFSVQTDGSNFTDLQDFYDYSFIDPNPPSFTEATLVISGSTLYGTTRVGGDDDNGCVFAIQTNGTDYTVLHSFAAFDSYGSMMNAEGALPEAGVTIAGNLLFGTASYGGTNGWGTVFMLKTDGSGFLNLHNFTLGPDGGHPSGDLAFSGNTLYGTATDGGTTNGGGTLFSLNIGPGISELRVNGSNLIISGTNGLPGQTYAVLTSTNPGAPMNLWSTIATSTPTNNGNFTITVARTIGADPATFFALRMQ